MAAGDRQSGFTLIELLVTIVVAAILVTVAVPSYESLISRNRFVSDYNQMLVSFHYARSEAIKRREDVLVVVSRVGDHGWELEIKLDDGSLLRNVDRSDSTIGVEFPAGSDGSLTFNSLGRLVAGSGCEEIEVKGGVDSGFVRVGVAGSVGETCV